MQAGGLGWLTAKRAIRRPLVRWRHRGLGPGDVLVSAYPKSGSTWLRFLLYEAITSDSAEFVTVNRGIPGPHGKRFAIRLPYGGRIFSSHELYWPAGARVVYLIRDARDVALSAYRADVRGGVFRGDVDRYLDLFLRGRINYFGTWVRHVEFWALSGRVPHQKLLVVRFEELRRSPGETLERVLGFLGIERPPEVIEAAVAGNSLENMRLKEDRAPPKVIRKVDPSRRFVGEGRVEGWRGTLSEAQLRRLEDSVGEALVKLGYATRRGHPAERN